MTLNDFIETLIHAGSPSWHRTVDGGNSEDVFSHYKTGVYRSDISITMAWGFELHRDYKAKWSGTLPGAESSSRYADIFFNGGLVLRVPYVVVEGGILPMPIGNEPMSVPRRYYSLVRLVAALDGHHDYDKFVNESGLKVVDERWHALD